MSASRYILSTAEHAVVQSRGVSEQITYSDIPIRRDGGEGGLSGGWILSLDPNLEIFELRDVFGDGIVEQEASFLMEHHRTHAGDGLGHRIVTEDRIFDHRLAGLHVHLPEGLEIGTFPPASDEHDGPRHVLCGDVPLHEIVDASRGKSSADGNKEQCGSSAGRSGFESRLTVPSFLPPDSLKDDESFDDDHASLRVGVGLSANHDAQVVLPIFQAKGVPDGLAALPLLFVRINVHCALEFTI